MSEGDAGRGGDGRSGCQPDHALRAYPQELLLASGATLAAAVGIAALVGPAQVWGG